MGGEGERRAPSLQELHISLSFDEKHISGFDSLEEGDILKHGFSK